MSDPKDAPNACAAYVPCPPELQGVASPAFKTPEEADAWTAGYLAGHRAADWKRTPRSEPARLDADRSAKPKTRIVASGFEPVDPGTTVARGALVPPGDTYVAEDGRRIPLVAPRPSYAKRMHTNPADWLPCKDGLRHHVDCGLFSGVACSCVPREMNPGATPLNESALSSCADCGAPTAEFRAGRVSDPCPKSPRGLPCRPEGDAEPSDLDVLATWIASRVKLTDHCDHACAECIPEGVMVVAGFRCAVHIAHAIAKGVR